MNRLISLSLALLFLLSCTACVGRAAAPADDAVQAEPLEAAVLQPPEAEQPEEPAGEPAVEPEEPYVRVIDPSKPMVALTFDDGPDGTYSDQILDILAEHHALATFFEVGKNVRAYPEPVKRMAEMGCEVASHSNAHKNLSKLRTSALLNDLDTADEAFIAAGVDAPTMVRPPYGAVNKTVKSATGRAMVTWTVDTEDWKSRDAQTVVEYVQGYGNLDGEIILMHSIYKSTAEATAILVPWLQEQGYQLVTVTELMAYYYGELPQPDHFYGYTYFTTHGRTDTPIELPSMFPPVPEEETQAGEEGTASEAAPEAAPVEAPVEESAEAPAKAAEKEAPADSPKTPEQPHAQPPQNAPGAMLSSGSSVPNPALFNP